jgi:hypothetical protein
MTTFGLDARPQFSPPLARSLGEVVQALARCDAHLKAAVALPHGIERATLVAAVHADANVALRAIESHCDHAPVSPDDARFFAMCRRMIAGLLRALEGPPE